MNRQTFLRRTLGLAGLAVLAPAEALAAIPAPAPALPWAQPDADPIADILTWAERAREDAGLIVASGGLCAPLTPYYSIHPARVAGVVRESLPVFRADRGGITYPTPSGV